MGGSSAPLSVVPFKGARQVPIAASCCTAEHAEREVNVDSKGAWIQTRIVEGYSMGEYRLVGGYELRHGPRLCVRACVVGRGCGNALTFDYSD